MKRFLITILVFSATVFAANAQSYNALSTAAKFAFNYLTSEGYRPYIDEDNDVMFKAQGYTFYIDGKKELREINAEFRRSYTSGALGPDRTGCVMEEDG